MPEEFGRTTKNKKITLPNGATVVIPVVTKISFIDPVDRYQETEYAIDNGLQSSREVHVDQVTGSGSGSLPVERIDVWPVIDSVELGQETRLSLDNATGADTTPPHFTSHIKTHVVRYINTPDNGTFIEAELIDEFSVVDPVQQGQETHYFVNNPDPESGVVQAIAGDDDITNDGGEGASVANPARTDPFQNIVNWSSGGAPQQYAWWYFRAGASAFQHPTALNTATTLFEGYNAGDLSKGGFITANQVFGRDPAHAPAPGGFGGYRFLGAWAGGDLADQGVAPPPPPPGNATIPNQPWSTLGNFSMHIYDGGLGSGMTLVPQYDFPWSGPGLPTPPNQPGGTFTFNDEGASFVISALWVMSGTGYFFELPLDTDSELLGLDVTSLPRYRVLNNVFSGAGDGWEVTWGPFGPFMA